MVPAFNAVTIDMKKMCPGYVDGKEACQKRYVSFDAIVVTPRCAPKVWIWKHIHINTHTYITKMTPSFSLWDNGHELFLKLICLTESLTHRHTKGTPSFLSKTEHLNLTNKDCRRQTVLKNTIWLTSTTTGFLFDESNEKIKGLGNQNMRLAIWREPWEFFFYVL